MEKLNKVVFFANPNGQNERVLEFAKTFDETAKTEFQVISLAESLPDYANFPSSNRKKRLEEVLSNSAVETARSLTQRLSEIGLSCRDPEVVNGRYPDSVEKWLETNNPDLLVKQPLPCDGEYGHISKGDLRLSRHVAIPILLLSDQFVLNGSVLVAIPPLFNDRSGLSRAVKIIKEGVYWAKHLGASLHFVHAWVLFGESLLKSRGRTTKEELDEELTKAEERAMSEVKTAIGESHIPDDMNYKIHVHKGDPTRVLIAQIELLKPTLAVLGSVANDGVKGVLQGNTAETVARRKLTNTLIIK